ncbi:hypothetical protein GN156_13890 [bacterium LRH843]|nr:hypothetical protein [bacterium LRH843]
MEKEKECRTICKGIWIGSGVALTVLFAKKEYRTNMIEAVKKAKDCTRDAFTFVCNNREQILDQIRSTACEVTTVVRSINEDVKQIRETATHLKESSEEIVKVTKDAASEMKNIITDHD